MVFFRLDIYGKEEAIDLYVLERGNWTEDIWLLWNGSFIMEVIHMQRYSVQHFAKEVILSTEKG